MFIGEGLVIFNGPIRNNLRNAGRPKPATRTRHSIEIQNVLVTKENWPEVKKDLEAGIARISVNPDGTTVRVNSESFNGYDFPVKFIQKLQKAGELPKALLDQVTRKL